MDLQDIHNNLADQEKGFEFELTDPATGALTGIKIRVAGPDSKTQRKARLNLVDHLASLAEANGSVSAENQEKAKIASLAACVLDWNLSENGKALPCTTANIIHVLSSVLWIEAQVDGFADNRMVYQKG